MGASQFLVIISAPYCNSESSNGVLIRGKKTNSRAASSSDNMDFTSANDLNCSLSFSFMSGIEEISSFSCCVMASLIFIVDSDEVVFAINAFFSD